jgi:hypothetical protein
VMEVDEWLSMASRKANLFAHAFHRLEMVRKILGGLLRNLLGIRQCGRKAGRGSTTCPTATDENLIGANCLIKLQELLVKSKNHCSWSYRSR